MESVSFSKSKSIKQIELTTSLYYVIQQCQVPYIFIFYVFYFNLKEKKSQKKYKQ